MDPTPSPTVENVTTVPSDAPGFDGAAALPWIGGFSGLALIVAILVAWSLRSRRPAPTFDEPVDDVVPADHRAPPPASAAGDGLGGLLQRALANSRSVLKGGLDAVFGGKKVEDAAFDELEEALLRSDVSLRTAKWLLDPIRAAARGPSADPAALRQQLRDAIRTCLSAVERPLRRPDGVAPWVILVVGVNGSGKTTTIGKLAARFQGQGQRVLVAAGDTYRAAAVEQLKEWASRAGAEVVAGSPGADPGAVVHDALTAARARGCDVVIIDTAGRLQTARPLMEQLSKVRRVIDKVVPGAPHETLLVLDGTMGQNGLSQAVQFHEATPLTGVVVTKLDGTAKGGMLLTLAHELAIPVPLLGLGEGVADLRDFEAEAFVEALA
jgi:fused signal recognition particle receptor